MKNKFRILILIIALGCNSPLEDPDHVPAEKMLQLTGDPSSIPSHGQGRAVITARIPKEAGILDVTFKTTSGTFPQVNAKEIKEYTDSLAGDYRYASTTLVSDTAKVTAYVTAEVKSSRVRIPIVIH